MFRLSASELIEHVDDTIHEQFRPQKVVQVTAEAGAAPGVHSGQCSELPGQEGAHQREGILRLDHAEHSVVEVQF